MIWVDDHNARYERTGNINDITYGGIYIPCDCEKGMETHYKWYKEVADLYEKLIAKEDNSQRKQILISLADGHAEDNK